MLDYMKRAGLKDMAALEAAFEERVLSLASAAGRAYIIWQDVVDNGVKVCLVLMLQSLQLRSCWRIVIACSTLVHPPALAGQLSRAGLHHLAGRCGQVLWDTALLPCSQAGGLQLQTLCLLLLLLTERAAALQPSLPPCVLSAQMAAHELLQPAAALEHHDKA